MAAGSKWMENGVELHCGEISSKITSKEDMRKKRTLNLVETQGSAKHIYFPSGFEWDLKDLNFRILIQFSRHGKVK